MQYELTIEKGKEETIISYLKKFDFVTIRKKTTAKKNLTKKKVKKTDINVQEDLPYFGAMPDWDFDFDGLRRDNYRKTKTKW